MRRLTLLGLGLAFALLGAGCAPFHLPKEFKEGKHIEDPPGSALPVQRSWMPC